MKNTKVLIISDLHAPYFHIDTIKFLRALKKKYNPDRVILTGDEIDQHAMSFHDHDPDLFSAGHELERAIGYLSNLYKMFPVADIMESNHGSMVYRRAKTHGIPRRYIKTYRDVLEAPDKWNWHPDLTFKMSNGQNCYASHGMGGKALKVSQSQSMCCIQGHRHSEFSIEYWANSKELMWAMQVGCMVDRESLAMEYGRNFVRKPILGHGIITNGIPKLLPMMLDKKSRWNEVVP